jgi:hypothetical protein
VEDSPSERFGYVVKVANDPRRWTATVTVILFAIAPRRLGPSGEIVAGNNTVFDLAPTTYVAPVPYSPRASGTAVNLDGETFSIGDYVVLRSPSLAVISNIRVIDNIGGSKIYLSSAFNVTPSAGDVLTLADIEFAPYPAANDFGFFDVSTFGI